MKFISLFAGIGGLDLGLERAGMECVAQVENDSFCQKVLTKHWPDVPKFGDIKDVGKHNLPKADLICGGFPCQPHSTAGKQKGEKDDRDLWPEYFRVIKELRPAWVIGENVPGIRTTILDKVLSDLESEKYSTVTIDIPACAFNAPHKRNRYFILAHSDREGWERILRNHPKRVIENIEWKAESGALGSLRDYISQLEKRLGEPCVRGNDDGIPSRVDRLRGLGNAVVPQVAEFIGKILMELPLLKKEEMPIE